MATKPAVYTQWTDGAPTKVVQPPAAQLLSGFVPGEPPAAQYINWVLWNLGQWTQYLDQTLAASGAANAGALDNARLIGGGNWSFAVGSGTLAWSGAFNIAIPGIVDADNQAAAGSVVVPDGSVAYVVANIPFLTSGNTTSGSNQLTSIAYGQGIAVGQAVNGAGIPAGTTITAFSGATATMSASATATATGVSLSFAGSGALTVLVANEGAFQPPVNTVVLARRTGSLVIIGINAGEMVLRDGESKLLRTTGYSQVYTGIAGENLAAGQAVYVSPGGSDGGRTLNSLYKADASIANGAIRAQCLGLVMTAASAGAGVQVVATGAVNSLSGLSVGTTYYVSPSTPGALVSGRPTSAGQWAAPVGVAVSATQVLVNAGVGAEIVVSGGNQGTYGVFSEAQLVAAITAAQAAGGGVIVIQIPFAISAARTIPAGVILLGQLGQAVLTIGTGGELILADGASMRDVSVASAIASGRLVTLSGNYAKAVNCRFAPTAGTTEVCLTVWGNAVRIRDCVFAGCAQGTPTGINYAGGVNNIDDSSVFT